MSAHDDLTEERFSKASHDLWWTQPKVSFDRLAAATRVAIVKGCELRAVDDEARETDLRVVEGGAVA